MPNIFRKTNRASANFFKKVGRDTSNFFKKTVPDLANKAGDGIEKVGGEIGGGMKKVGSVLEKAAPAIATGLSGALLATGYGAPLAGAVMAAGNSGAVVGRQLKNSGKTVQSSSSKFGADVKAQAPTYSGRANDFVQNKITNLGKAVATNMNGMEAAVKGVGTQPTLASEKSFA